MYIRAFAADDVDEIISLFHGTVHNVNCRDYDVEQVAAWAPNDINRETWCRDLECDHSFVMIHETAIVGFAELTADGVLHRLFVHQNFQHQGIARALYEHVEKLALQLNFGRLEAAVSLTARTFFEAQGFSVVKQQQVERQGVKLINFKMIKML